MQMKNMARPNGTLALAFALSLLGCGADAGGLDAGAVGPGTDGGARDGSAPEIDAGTPGDGAVSSDAGTNDGGAVADAGPASACSERCDDEACFNDAACVTRDLERLGYADYTPCGPARTFSEGDSHEVCAAGPPFADWGTLFECERARFSGTLTFYCAPDASQVVTRFVVNMDFDPPTGITGWWSSYGTEFADGSTGGSGESHIHVDEGRADAGHVGFVGYHTTRIGAPRVGSTVWFVVDDLFLSADVVPAISGGYQVTLTPTGPEAP